MISLYLKPNCTQVVKAKLKKDRTLSIMTATEMNPYLNSLKDGNISEMFAELKSIVNISYEEIYIVLPDFLFTIDCYEYTSEDELTNLVNDNLSYPDQMYQTYAVDCNPGTSHKKTLFAIDKKYIDKLIEAAAQENITLTSVEPASIAFFRSQASWKMEHFLVEIFQDKAMMVSFSPVAGIFKLDMPGLATDNLFKDAIDADKIMQSAFAQHDFTAEKTFKSMNTDVPFVFLVESKKDEILNLDSVKKRLAPIAKFPDFIKSDISIEYQQNFMCTVGTFLQIYERADTIYNDLPSYLNIGSANLLPKEVRLSARFKQIKHRIKSVSRYCAIFLCAIMFAEISGIIYYSNIEIPQQLQANYDQAKKDIKDIDSEIKIITTAKKNDEHPMEAFNTVLKDRPNNCGFITLAVGNTSTNSKSDEKNWLKLTAVAQDPMIFQGYITSLSSESIFNNVSISKIDTDSSGLKVADFTIGKGQFK